MSRIWNIARGEYHFCQPYLPLRAVQNMETTDILTENKLTCVSRHVTKLLVRPDKEKNRLSAYWESLDVFEDAICCIGAHVP